MPNWSKIDQLIESLDSVVPNYKIESNLLCQLGRELKVLSEREIQAAAPNGLTPQQRCQVIEAALVMARAEFSKKNLLVLVFGYDQLSEWLKRSRQAYPDFDLAMGVRLSDDTLEICTFWHPRRGGPAVSTETDFLWKPTWDLWEHFWGGLNGVNQVEDMLAHYSSQRKFTTKRKVLDWELELRDDPDQFFVHDLVKARAVA